MKKDIKKESTEDAVFAALKIELLGSDDFILTYLRSLCILHGGAVDLQALAIEHGWKQNKLSALTSAAQHFAARGRIKRTDGVYKLAL
jgi:hypothetical protein